MVSSGLCDRGDQDVWFSAQQKTLRGCIIIFLFFFLRANVKSVSIPREHNKG